MNGTTIDYSAARASANNLVKYATELEEALNIIKSEFYKIDTQEVWSGNSAVAVREKLDALSSRFAMLSEAINDCGKFVNSSAERYESAERAISSDTDNI